MTRANTKAIQRERPVLNHKYTGHKDGCILLVMLHNKAASDWLILGIRNPCI